MKSNFKSSQTLGSLVTIGILTVLVIQCKALNLESKRCAVLYEDQNYGGQEFNIGDGKSFSNLEQEHVSSSTVWNLTLSFKVVPECLFTACNESYFTGQCQEFRMNSADLPMALKSLNSVNCTCATDCQCSSIQKRMRKSSCARVYLDNGCNTCNTLYTDLKGDKVYFTEDFQKRMKSIIVRQGCTLSVYDDEDYEGKESIYDGIIESPDAFVSYKCSCSNGQNRTSEQTPRSLEYPDWIDVPQTADQIMKMVDGKAGRHPALMAALKSLKHKRSSKNAYILLLGTTGSGKSSAINLLFDNPNLTKIGDGVSTTFNVHEFRVPVQVDELGIANSELRVIDTPGLGDTEGLEKDAKILATLDEFLRNHEELRDRIPNVVLVFHKFSDNRFSGLGSNFVKMLRGLDFIRERITDKEYSNVVFVLSHFTAEDKVIQRKPKVKLASFKRTIEDFSQFAKPVSIAVAENKAEIQELPLLNGYYRLPNGDYYPRNVFDKIQLLTSSGEDPIGESIITAAFRDSDGFNISYITTALVGSGHSKVLKCLGFLIDINNSPEDTEVSQLLGNASETMSADLHKKFPAALNYLQKALNFKKIVHVDDIPRTTVDIIKLLTDLKLNEAILFLLQKGLSIRPATLMVSPVTGYSYNVFKDTPLPMSPLKLGKMKNSDIGYNFPAVMSCVVERRRAEIFKIFENKEEYVQYRLESLKIDGNITSSHFTNETRAGSNIKGITINSNGSRISALREFRYFQLVLNNAPELSQQFIDTLKVLTPFNKTDLASVDNWKSFFNEYGTHVVQSAYGGGSIEIELISNKQLGPDAVQLIHDFVQFAEDAAVNIVTNLTLSKDGIEHRLKFHGGDHAYHTTDLTKMKLDDAAKLLENWKESLKLSPTILTSETRLIPISELAKKVGQNISLEIQRATELLFNSSLIYEIQKTKKPPAGPSRDEVRFKQEAAVFTQALTMLMDDLRKGEERFHTVMQRMAEDRKRTDAWIEELQRREFEWDQKQMELRESEQLYDLEQAQKAELEREKVRNEMRLEKSKTIREKLNREQEYKKLLASNS